MSAAEPPRTTKRLAGVDATRLIAFVAVCFVHTTRWSQPPNAQPDAVDWLILACRFCVPFFFLASGYFSAGVGRTGGAFVRLLSRIALIFCVWTLLYVALTPGGVGRLANLKFDLITLIDGGPGFHLWFLPALAAGLTVTVGTGGLPRRLRWTIAALAWLFGWAACSFGPGRLGPYAGRYLVGISFVLAGALRRTGRSDETTPHLLIAGLIGGGLLLSVVEASVPDPCRARPFDQVEFPLGVGLLGYGAFLASVAWRPVSRVSALVARLGRRVLGLYAVHLGVAMLLFTVLPFATLAQRLAVFLMTVVASIVAVELLRRTPLRRIVE